MAGTSRQMSQPETTAAGTTAPDVETVEAPATGVSCGALAVTVCERIAGVVSRVVPVGIT